MRDFSIGKGKEFTYSEKSLSLAVLVVKYLKPLAVLFLS